MNLADLQSRFARALLEGDEAPVADALECGRFGVTSVLAMYRDCIESSLLGLLRTVYPAAPGIEIAFIRSHPPKTAMLHHYAEEYAVFLSRVT